MDFGAPNISNPLIDPFRSKPQSSLSLQAPGAVKGWTGGSGGGLTQQGGSYYAGGLTYNNGGQMAPRISPPPAPPVPGSGQTLGASTGGGGGGDSEAQLEAQRKAEEAARVQGLRDEITARRQRANSIFETLTAAVQNLAKDKRAEFEKSFADQQKSATDTFEQESGLIANRYRGRGLGDSTYKTYALEDAGESYENTVTQLGRERKAGLADIGAATDEQLARIGADRQATSYDNLLEVGRREDGTFDPAELIKLRAKIDERIRDAEVQQAQVKTSGGFRGSLNQIAPYSGAVDTLKASLSQLARSAAPKQVKDRIAQTLIGNYAPQDGNTWTKFYSDEEKKTQQA